MPRMQRSALPWVYRTYLCPIEAQYPHKDYATDSKPSASMGLPRIRTSRNCYTTRVIIRAASRVITLLAVPSFDLGNLVSGGKVSGGEETKWLYDYERFVQVSKKVMQGRNRKQQQEVVRKVLLSMLPPGAPAQFRKLFPPTKWAAEFNAALTVPFFHWLVGPSEVIEVEIDGVKQKSGVHIKKCRYLENSGCVGMCVNMCKIPTQDFFTNEFGLPLTMTPNFEDMSCEMVYGQVPPPFEEDPVSKQPCLADICSISNPYSPLCPTLEG